MAAARVRPLLVSLDVFEGAPARLNAEQWDDVELRAWRAYDRGVRERFGLRELREDAGANDTEEADASEYDEAVERPAPGTGGAAAAAAAAAAVRTVADSWSSYVMQGLRLGLALRAAMARASRLETGEEDEGPVEPAVKETTMARKAWRREKLKEILEAGPKSRADIVAAFGGDAAAEGGRVDATLYSLKKAGVVVRDGDAWRLADDSPAALSAHAPAAVARHSRRTLRQPSPKAVVAATLVDDVPILEALRAKEAELEAKLTKVRAAIEAFEG